jgi:cytochrome c oxidase cbb3-type subunit 3
VTVYVRSLRQSGERKAATKLPDGPLVVNPNGPHPKFELREDMYVSVDQVNAALAAGARMVLADARAQSDYLEVHLPGAISLPFYAVHEYAEKLPRDGTWVIAYCACPHAASGRVARALRERGFPNTAVLDEGILVWMQRGYPITRPK